MCALSLSLAQKNNLKKHKGQRKAKIISNLQISKTKSLKISSEIKKLSPTYIHLTLDDPH